MVINKQMKTKDSGGGGWKERTQRWYEGYQKAGYSPLLDAWMDFIQKILLSERTKTLDEVVGKMPEEREHQHSIYTHCRSCHTWGVNMPNDRVCGNCGNTEDTTTYYPDDNYNTCLAEVKSIIEKMR